MRPCLALSCLLSLALLGACESDKGLDEAGAKAEAEKIWGERCTTCHGTKGAGDGPGAAALITRPRSFRDPAWQGSVDNERIKQVMVYGGASVGLSEAMAPNLDLKGRPAVQDALVKKVRSLVQ